MAGWPNKRLPRACVGVIPYTSRGFCPDLQAFPRKLIPGRQSPAHGPVV